MLGKRYDAGVTQPPIHLEAQKLMARLLCQVMHGHGAQATAKVTTVQVTWLSAFAHTRTHTKYKRILLVLGLI